MIPVVAVETRNSVLLLTRDYMSSCTFLGFWVIWVTESVTHSLRKAMCPHKLHPLTEILSDSLIKWEGYCSCESLSDPVVRSLHGLIAVREESWQSWSQKTWAVAFPTGRIYNIQYSYIQVAGRRVNESIKIMTHESVKHDSFRTHISVSQQSKHFEVQSQGHQNSFCNWTPTTQSCS